MPEIPVRPATAKPDWYVSDAAKRVEPSGSRKLNGWDPLEPLPAQSENWLLYSISIWLEYLDDYIFEYFGVYFGALGRGFDLTVAGPVTIDPDTDDGMVFLVDNGGSSFDFDLPAPADFEGMKFTVKDVGGTFQDDPCTLDRAAGGDLIEGLASDYLLNANFGTWTIYSDGVDWWII